MVKSSVAWVEGHISRRTRFARRATHPDGMPDPLRGTRQDGDVPRKNRHHSPATQLISLPSPTRHSRGSTGRGHAPEVLMPPIRHLRTIAVAGVALGLASCGGSSTAPKAPPAALTGLPRELTAVETSVRDAANAFSFALWRRVNQVQRDQNVFISPLSASFALVMRMNGAATHTSAEIPAGLHFL